MRRLPDFNRLQRECGITLPEAMDFIADHAAGNIELAMDVQPGLVTVSNAGIPAFLTTYVDPKLIEVLVQPMKAEVILGDALRKGDWLTETAMFPMIENVGEVSSYGDWNTNGRTSANSQFPQRQSYHYQTITEWGEKELARYGLAKIDYANRLSIASVLVLNKFQNRSYFYGVANLQNYGLLNDPALLSPISPTAAWSTSTADIIYADIKRLFSKLQAQCAGLIERDFKGVLAMSPTVETYLTATNQYNVNVIDQIKKNFPNLRIESAVEYTTGGGELVQMIVDEIEGQKTAEPAFTEKLRAHPVKLELSSFKQKKSQGTWGTIVYRPFAISQMLGIT